MASYRDKEEVVVMNGFIDFENLSKSLQEGLKASLSDKSPEELKSLDWFSWETDFFIEQKRNQDIDKAA